MLYKLILNFQGSTVSLKFWIPCFLKHFIKNIRGYLKYFSWDITKRFCFLRIQTRKPFCHFRHTNFCKVEWRLSRDIFPIIFTFRWSLKFSSTISTGSPTVAVFVPKLSEYSVIPNFVIAFGKYSLSVLATSRSSDIISLLLSQILFHCYYLLFNFFSVLSSSFLSASVILDDCAPLILIRGLTVLQNLLLSVTFF